MARRGSSAPASGNCAHGMQFEATFTTGASQIVPAHGQASPFARLVAQQPAEVEDAGFRSALVADVIPSSRLPVRLDGLTAMMSNAFVFQRRASGRTDGQYRAQTPAIRYRCATRPAREGRLYVFLSAIDCVQFLQHREPLCRASCRILAAICDGSPDFSYEQFARGQKRDVPPDRRDRYAITSSFTTRVRASLSTDRSQCCRCSRSSAWRACAA